MGRVLKNEVGKRIRALRKSRGIAPGEIADACDMTPDAIYRLESGYGDFPARVLTAYADILGMSVDYLLGRIGGELPPEYLEYDRGEWEIVPELQAALSNMDPDLQYKMLRVIDAVMRIKDARVIVKPAAKSKNV